MGTAAEATLWIAVPGMVPFGGSRKGGIAQEGLWWKDNTAENNLAAPGIFLSNRCISCVYKYARYFPYSAFWEKRVWTYRCGVGLHCEQFLVMISKGAEGNLPWCIGVVFVPQPALTSADRLENKCLKSHHVSFFSVSRHWNRQWNTY